MLCRRTTIAAHLRNAFFPPPPSSGFFLIRFFPLALFFPPGARVRLIHSSPPDQAPSPSAPGTHRRSGLCINFDPLSENCFGPPRRTICGGPLIYFSPLLLLEWFLSLQMRGFPGQTESMLECFSFFSCRLVVLFRVFYFLSVSSRPVFGFAQYSDRFHGTSLLRGLCPPLFFARP